MQEQLYEILSYLKGALKYKWIAIIIAWIICLSGWLYVSAMPNKYTSQAKVHVETRTMLQPLLSGMTIESDVRGLLRVMQQLMFTKSNLEQIIKLSELGSTVKTAKEQDKLIEELKRDIHINGGADDMFVIQYEAKNPDQAKNVVQAVLTVFSEQTQLSTLGNVDSAQRFIDEQLQEYEMRLRNGEKARENFKRANLGLLPGQGGDQINQIQQMTTALEESKLALKEVISKKEALKKQLADALSSDNDDLAELSGSLSLPDDPQLADLKQKKDELLIKFTENHPSVVYIEKTIKELKKHLAEKQAKSVKAGGLDAAVMTNPYVQSIQVALNQVDADMASINSRVDIFEKRLQKSQDELNSRLSIETEIENLNRDYDAIKGNYNRLLASKEQAAMSEKVDNQAEALKFKIADAPNTPLQPSSPKRKLLFSGVLIVGIIFGLVIALLLYLIRPTIMSISQLRQISGLPVLGSVSLKPTDIQTEKIKKEVFRYSFAITGIVVVYIGFITIDILEIKILSLSHLLQSIH
ncbi:MAG: XrtA system polysaccharide chain length determinant [Methylococcaceae bacterium]